MSDLTHYVYFDKKTGSILSVGNEINRGYEHGIRVSFEDAEGLISGRLKFKDYLVGYRRDETGNTELAVVPNTDQGYAFKNNVFEWITEDNDKAECLVTWNKKQSRWEFSISKEAASAYDIMLAPKLLFFVTLESDFDFLIRTIIIDLADLISSESVNIPFESNVETKIDKISISSKLVFKSYGLRIINE